MAVREGWKTTGLIKGPGIPAPTGQYTVGCVDLMQKLEGDNDGLLVRLFYPTVPQIQEGAGYQYAKWTPHKRYTKGFMEFNKIKLSGLLSSITNLVLGIKQSIVYVSSDISVVGVINPSVEFSVLTDPRMPAFDGAPLFKAATVTTTNEIGSESTGRKGESEEGTTADGEPSSAEVVNHEEQPSSKEIRFPVIVFSHGLGAMRTVYSAICIDMASHGYVIAAVEHRSVN